MANLKEAYKKYRTNDGFYALVNHLCHLLKDDYLTGQDIENAMILAEEKARAIEIRTQKTKG